MKVTYTLPSVQRRSGWNGYFILKFKRGKTDQDERGSAITLTVSQRRANLIEDFKTRISDGGLECYFCNEGIVKLSSRDGDALTIHSLDGNHENWNTYNKVPTHKACHNIYHSKAKTKMCSKLSQLQKIILSKLYLYKVEHNWEAVPHYRLTRDIAELYERVVHVDRYKVLQKMLDSSSEILRNADDREKVLILRLQTSYLNSIPKRGHHFVNASARASISRSTRRLEQRGLVEKSLGWIKLKVSLDWIEDLMSNWE